MIYFRKKSKKMKNVILLTLALAANYLANGQGLEFEFIADSERTVSIGQAAPKEYATAMEPKLITFKNNVLTITTIGTGKQYDKVEVVRTVEFKKDKLTTYALEVKDKSGIFKYYLYRISKNISFESKSLITPYVVEGRLIMENTFIEKP
jgi:hypothetical protein